MDNTGKIVFVAEVRAKSIYRSFGSEYCTKFESVARCFFPKIRKLRLNFRLFTEITAIILASYIRVIE